MRWDHVDERAQGYRVTAKSTYGRRMRPIASATVTLLLAASLVGCGGGDGGSDAPAVCASADTLRTSVAKLKDVEVRSSGAISDLESGLTDVESDLSELKADAKSEFSSQVEAAHKSYDALKNSVSAAKADRSAATLAATGSALSSFATDVDTLISDIEATC